MLKICVSIFSVFLIFLLNLLINIPGASSQDLNIGVPLVEEPSNLFSSNDYFSKFILSASTQPLIKVENTEKSKFRLILADSISFDADQKHLEVRLRADAMFVNSEMVSKEDLSASFERCLSNFESDHTSRFKVKPRFSIEAKENRVKVLVYSDEGKDALLTFVSNCPILEARSIRLFGEDLGSSNALVGSGPYDLTSRIKNREARLERLLKTNSNSGIWAAAIILRGFADSGHALTALRTGTVDAFFTEDTGTKEKAANDPTLRIRECGVYNIILRKGLEISCFPDLDPGTVKYSAL